MKLSFTLALLAGAVLAAGDKKVKISGKEKKYLWENGKRVKEIDPTPVWGATRRFIEDIITNTIISNNKNNDDTQNADA